MKKNILIAAIIAFSIFGNLSAQNSSSEESRKEYEMYLNAHPYTNRAPISQEEIKKLPKKDRPDLAWEQNYISTMDPATKRPETKRLFPVFEATKIKTSSRSLMKSLPGDIVSPWTERGPNNVAGRTRAVLWDPVNPKKIWAGGVNGGLWYNNDITNSASSWTAVNGFWDNIAISCLAADPNNSQIMYAGTGEGYTAERAASGSRGAGVWKTIDGGITWNQLPSTNEFYFVYDIVVRNESGNSVLYAGVGAHVYGGILNGIDSEGMQRSTNGGTTWNQVMPNISGSPVRPTSIELDANNNLWVSTMDNINRDGGGNIYFSNTGASYSLKHTHTRPGRVEIACAPSNANVIYALFEAFGRVNAIKSSNDGGTTWTSHAQPSDFAGDVPNNDFGRDQAWYNLCLDVDPNDDKSLIIGGISLFKSDDGMQSWAQMSDWRGRFGLQGVHADQHIIKYKNGSSSEIIFGNDGGVYYSGNGEAGIPTVNRRNNGYNVTQYYSCAIHPDAGNNNFLAGSQDNGTQRYSTRGMNSTREVNGGDGGYCHIDQTNGNYQFASFIYNRIFRSVNGGNKFNDIINEPSGKFINPSDLDNNQNILYANINMNSLYRLSNTEGTINTEILMFPNSLGAEVSHIAVSPYTTTSTTLFIGTDAGRLWRIRNANGNAVMTEITSNNFPTGSISCVAFGANEEEMLITFYNYGVASVWHTSDGGQNWMNKEGDLPDMPVRWALFNPLNFEEVILATEVGIWSTNKLSEENPTWKSSNSGLANVRIDMLKIRESDNEVIASTHGRGLFSSNGFNNFATDFSADNTTPNTSTVVNFTDLTNHVSDTWNWKITPNAYTFVDGTNANSQNPSIRFNKSGCYSVELNAANGGENDTEIKTDYICINYCPSNFTEIPSEYISNVSFRNINNTTGNEPADGYGDYTSQFTDVLLDSTYELSVTINTSGPFTDHCWAYFDWNNNADLNDPGEAFDLGDLTDATAGVLLKNITVPTNAAHGNTRMRIITQYEQDPDGPCNDDHNSEWGETEDYTINVKDTSSMSWLITPSPIILSCDDSRLPSNTGQASVESTCQYPTLTVTYKDFITPSSCKNAFTINRVWTASDSCGNNEIYTQIIEIQDTQAPSIVCPDDLIQPALNGFFAELDNYTTMAIVSDNCSSPEDITITQSPAIGSIQTLGTITVELTVTDECGLTTNCSFDVEITDGSSIIWTSTTAADTTINCDASILPSSTGEAEGLSFCQLGGYRVAYSDITTPGSCPNNFIINRTWIAQNLCGNSATYTQVITVKDTSFAIINCPAPQIQVAPDKISTALADYTSLISVTDNCSNSEDVIITQSPLPGTIQAIGTVQLEMTAIDECGNTASCTFNVRISDGSTITWTSMPADLTVQCDKSTLPANTGQATASSDCSSNSLNVAYNDQITSETCANTFTIKRTWIAADNCQNITSFDQIIKVLDIYRPTLTCSTLVDKILTTDDSVALPNYISTATATDGCSPIVMISQIPDQGTMLPVGTDNIVVITAVDDCNNATTCNVVSSIINAVGIDKKEQAIGLKIYPNPSQGQFYLAVELNTIEYLAFEIIDKLGRVVLKSTSNNPEEPILLDLMNEPTGVYFIRILVDGQFINKRIVKT